VIIGREVRLVKKALSGRAQTLRGSPSPVCDFDLVFTKQNTSSIRSGRQGGGGRITPGNRHRSETTRGGPSFIYNASFGEGKT